MKGVTRKKCSKSLFGYILLLLVVIILAMRHGGIHTGMSVGQNPGPFSAESQSCEVRQGA